MMKTVVVNSLIHDISWDCVYQLGMS